MSLPSARNDLAYEMAPHLLHNSLYNAQSSISPYLLPPANFPIRFDSVVYPSVDGQFINYYNTPRTVGPASNSIGIYGGYRQTQSLEPASPASVSGLSPLGRGMAPTTRLGYLGCATRQ